MIDPSRLWQATVEVYGREAAEAAYGEIVPVPSERLVETADGASISLAGRTRVEEETDHDRMQHDIVHGLADGKKGWIDPNTGQLKDEPKRKLIT